MHFYHHGDAFYNRYINTESKTKYIDDYGTRINQYNTIKNNTEEEQ